MIKEEKRKNLAKHRVAMNSKIMFNKLLNSLYEYKEKTKMFKCEVLEKSLKTYNLNE